MSLEKLDARTKLEPHLHAALLAICDVDGVTINDFLYGLVVPVIEARIRDARLLADRTRELGISGKSREPAVAPLHGASSR